jgi:hypothetical protein
MDLGQFGLTISKKPTTEHDVDYKDHYVSTIVFASKAVFINDSSVCTPRIAPVRSY